MDQQQFIIIVASACGAGLIFCLLMVLLCYLHQQRRKAYWREDTAHNHNNNTGMKGEDAALEDLESSSEGIHSNNGSNNNKRRGRLSLRGSNKKKSSLHLRDSLQDWHDLNTVQLPPAQKSTPTSPNDAGSGRLMGSILSTAAAAMLPALGDDDNSLEKPGVVHRKRSNSTSSCSRSEEEDSLPQPGNNRQQRGNAVATGDVADDLTCPSDFEGNAVIRPNLVPVPTNMDQFNDDGDNNDNIGGDNDIVHIAHEPLPPPSRTASARRDELPISMNSRVNSASSPPSNTTDTFTTPTKTTRSRSSSHDGGGGGFMAKYIHPIAGSVSLPYFGGSFDGAADSANRNSNSPSGNKKNISPRTEATTPEKDVDTDARWSDISSELDVDMGNKTDDEFDNDDTWDPDDASITSSQCGKDVFSPMTASRTNDEIRLLKSIEGLKYNL